MNSAQQQQQNIVTLLIGNKHSILKKKSLQAAEHCKKQSNPCNKAWRAQKANISLDNTTEVSLCFQMVIRERGFYQIIKYMGRGMLKMHQIFTGSEYWG